MEAETKVCFLCKIPVEVSLFNFDKKAKDGLRASCKPCLKIKSDAWRKANPEKMKAKGNSQKRKDYHNEYRRNRKEIRRLERQAYVAKNRDKIKEQKKEWERNNKDKIKLHNKRTREKHPEHNRTAASFKRAIIRERTVPWSDKKKIKEVYKNCPEGMVVDHVIPLMGKTVSGLHVHENMQYLTPAANGTKSNKW